MRMSSGKIMGAARLLRYMRILAASASRIQAVEVDQNDVSVSVLVNFRAEAGAGEADQARQRSSRSVLGHEQLTDASQAVDLVQAHHGPRRRAGSLTTPRSTPTATCS